MGCVEEENPFASKECKVQTQALSSGYCRLLPEGRPCAHCPWTLWVHTISHKEVELLVSDYSNSNSEAIVHLSCTF